MTPGYAEVTFSLDFEIFSISQVSQAVHFTSVHSVANLSFFYMLDKDDDGFFTSN